MTTTSHPDTEPELPPANCFSETPKKVTEFTHEWTIHNFCFHPQDKKIESPAFSSAPDDGVQWQLWLYPDGNCEKNKSFISLFLVLLPGEAREVHSRFRISILNGNHELKETVSRRIPCVFKPKHPGWGWERFMKREEVLVSTNFPGDTLIVRIEVAFAPGEGPTVQSSSSFFPPGMAEYNLSADLRGLLENGMYSDVVFEVNRKEFRAHRAILATRSPTFKTFLEGNPGNTQPARLRIRDADDNTFSELLQLIYTGETNESYPRIQDLLSTIASQSKTTSARDSSEIGNQIETEGVNKTHSDETDERMSSKLNDTASADTLAASVVSISESMSALTASIDSLTLRLDSLAMKRISDNDPTETACKSHSGAGALLSSSRLSFPKNETSSSHSPDGESIRTTEIAGKPLSKNTELILSSKCERNLQLGPLHSSSIGAEEFQTPVVRTEKFKGDENTFFKWWREFKALVHGRQDLSLAQKSVVLLDALEGETRECINIQSSAQLSYFSTLDSLFLRYGNIEKLPPGMFTLFIVRRLDPLTLPFRFADNESLMELMEKAHRVPDATISPKSDGIEHEGDRNGSCSDMLTSKNPEGEGVPPCSQSECQCQALKLNQSEDEVAVHGERLCDCVVLIEQQLKELESLFAQTRSPDILTRKRLADKIGLSEVSVQMWFKLRPVNWRKMLHPHWQLGEMDLPKDSPTRIEESDSDSDSSDFEIFSRPSSASSSSESGFQLA